jgi:hypothetical protein
LTGPENDAKDFEDWLLDSQGGNVPRANIKTIVSSDYPSSKNTDDPVFHAKPAFFDVLAAFEKLRKISKKNEKDGLGPKVGRRLYIFMSGHGIAPTPFGNKLEKESALLMANADPDNIAAPQYHIPGTYAATWFGENEVFEEVFLFMDCCRDIETTPVSNIFLPPKGNATTAKRFYAFATQWSRRARERPMVDENGKVRGVFTKTLLLALRGAAGEPDPTNPARGIITFASLQSYLIQNTKSFIEPSMLDTEKQEPDVDYEPKTTGGREIIKTTDLQRFPVKIRVPAAASGAVTVLYNGLLQVDKRLISHSPADLSINLPRGIYSATVAVNQSSEMTQFVVTGAEGPGREQEVRFNV